MDKAKQRNERFKSTCKKLTKMKGDVETLAREERLCCLAEKGGTAEIWGSGTRVPDQGSEVIGKRCRDQEGNGKPPGRRRGEEEKMHERKGHNNDEANRSGRDS